MTQKNGGHDVEFTKKIGNEWALIFVTTVKEIKGKKERKKKTEGASSNT